MYVRLRVCHLNKDYSVPILLDVAITPKMKASHQVLDEEQRLWPDAKG